MVVNSVVLRGAQAVVGFSEGIESSQFYQGRRWTTVLLLVWFCVKPVAIVVSIVLWPWASKEYGYAGTFCSPL